MGLILGDRLQGTAPSIDPYPISDDELRFLLKSSAIAFCFVLDTEGNEANAFIEH